MGRPGSERQGQSLESTGGRHKGAPHPLSLMLSHYPCSLYSVKLGIFLCKKKKKKRYLLKNPHCLSGTGWLFPTKGVVGDNDTNNPATAAGASPEKMGMSGSEPHTSNWSLELHLGLCCTLCES